MIIVCQTNFRDLIDLWHRITKATTTDTVNMLTRTWQEIEHQLVSFVQLVVHT